MRTHSRQRCPHTRTLGLWTAPTAKARRSGPTLMAPAVSAWADT
jgi:hypothetical protein